MTQTHGDHVLEFDYQDPYQKTVLTEQTYDEQGLLLHEGTTTYEFNNLGNPMKVTDALGNVTEYDRDGRMNAVGTRLWEKTGPNPTDLTLLYEESREYTSDDQVDLLTEAVGFAEERTTDYFYENGLLRFVVRPSVVVSGQSKVLELEYYPSTALVRYRKERGFLGDGTAYEYVTEFQYDAV